MTLALPSQSAIPGSEDTPVTTRRGMLTLGLFTASFAPKRQPSWGQPFRMLANSQNPSRVRPNLMVAGPVNGRLAPWARRTAGAVNGLLADGNTLHILNIGGEDGVTAANQFEARTALDGESTLLVSGETAIAWLIGDPRAQFDIGKWMPVATGVSSGVMLEKSAGIDRNKPLRLASNLTHDHNLTAKLGLSLLGIEIGQVILAQDPVAVMVAGHADAVFLIGADAPRAARLATAANAKGVFSLGAYNEDGTLVRDPVFPTIPTLPEHMARREQTLESHNLICGWNAVAAAARLEFALVLPALSPAGTVAWWRKVAAQIGSTQGGVVHIDTETPNHAVLSNIAIDATTSLSLRSWIALRAG